MAEVDRPFITTLEHATLQMGNDADARPKYTISTIGQEIAFVALQVENAQEHVFGFFRAVANPDYVRDPGRSDPAGVTRRGPLKGAVILEISPAQTYIQIMNDWAD